MPRRYYSSTAARTTLASGVNDSATSFSVVAVSGWPSSFPYTLIIDQDTVNEEIVQVTARSGTSLTVVRAVDGTTGVAHSAGAAVNHGVSARDFNEPNQFLNEGGTVAGATAITANTTTPALQITQTGTGNALVVEDSTSPDATPFVVDAAGNVGIGTDTPLGPIHVAKDSPSHVYIDTAVTNATASQVIFRKARGTGASPTSVSSGDVVGQVRFDAHDGTQFLQGARITAAVASTPGTNDMPTNLLFSTTADGASSPTERMRITQAGNVGIGTSSPVHPLHVYQASANAIIFTQSGTVSSYAGYAASAGIAYNGTSTSHPYATLVNNTERMRIDTAGLITGTGTSLGAWTAYTPTLSVWTLGNGTVSGSYCQIGKVVHFRILMIVGSTTTIGSSPTFTVPVTMASTSAWNVRGYFRDISGGGIYDLTARPASTSTIGGLYTGTDGQHLSFNATTPFTWASGDVINLAGTYEAA